MLYEIPVELETDFLLNRSNWKEKAKKIIYTGPLDAFYEYKWGVLDYRSIDFQSERLAIANYQGNAVVNHIDKEIPYTRTIEHKHFEFGTQPSTIITKEFPKEWKLGDEPYYPINDEINNNIYKKYKDFADRNFPNLLIGGRLGDYKYYDMDATIDKALALCLKEFS